MLNLVIRQNVYPGLCHQFLVWTQQELKFMLYGLCHQFLVDETCMVYVSSKIDTKQELDKNLCLCRLKVQVHTELHKSARSDRTSYPCRFIHNYIKV
jgi:hypothetical protein